MTNVTFSGVKTDNNQENMGIKFLTYHCLSDLGKMWVQEMEC